MQSILSGLWIILIIIVSFDQLNNSVKLSHFVGWETEVQECKGIVLIN